MKVNQTHLGETFAPKSQGYSISLGYGDFYFEIANLETDLEFQLWQKAANAYIEGCANTKINERIELTKKILEETLNELKQATKPQP